MATTEPKPGNRSSEFWGLAVITGLAVIDALRTGAGGGIDFDFDPTVMSILVAGWSAYAAGRSWVKKGSPIEAISVEDLAKALKKLNPEVDQ